MYDVIVIGLGSMGSAALYHFAKAGVRVLGIEQFGIVHDKGSHSGQSRIVRKAYFEHSDYVPLLSAAYQGWEDIQGECGEKLFYKTGLAYFGPSDHPVMNGVKDSSFKYKIPLSANDYSIFNQFQFNEKVEYLFEPEAGFALTDQTIRSYIKLAQEHNAQVKSSEQVIGISQKPDHISIKTTVDDYKTEKLVITAGAYINQLIDFINLELNVSRQLIAWVKPKSRKLFDLNSFPSWMIADDEYEGVFYGFPILSKQKFGGNELLKVAHHALGDVIEPSELQHFDPDIEKAKIESILKKYIPDAIGEIVSITACMYSNSTDEDFVIDFVPNTNENVVVATGFSGHGFKFVPVIGEILKDLALNGKTDYLIEFLNIDRFK